MRSPHTRFCSSALRLSTAPRTPAEFHQLRNLPGKIIAADIEFKAGKDFRPNQTFEGINILNSLGWEVTLNGTYKPDIPAVTFNFSIRGIGPICRVDVNGTTHGAAGRTHKHDLRRDEDPRRNLPSATARPDLVGKTPREVWEDLCQRAGIQHTGRFIDP